jgi:MFS family permease
MDAEVKPVGAPIQEKGGKRYVVLAMLLLVYVLNNLDRQIVGILAIPIKQDLHLTDTQLGLMGGIAFALLYTLLGIPVARLADRMNRVRILTVALVLWSGFTALCGFAVNFVTLFLARLGVGVGEAGGTAPSFSIVSDVFPPKQRGRALSVLFMASQIGSAAGLLLGGYIAAQPELGWRGAFIIVGLLGVVVAPFLLMLVNEPPRGRYDPPPVEKKAAIEKPSMADVFRFFAATPTVWTISLGTAFAAMFNYGLTFWMPSFISRSYEMPLVTVGGLLAPAYFFGGCGGVLISGWLGDLFGAKNARAYGWVTGGALLISLPFIIAVTLIPHASFVVALALITGAITTGNSWGPVSTAALQNVTPPSMRATVTAIHLLIANLIGLGMGTLVFGVLSDALAARYGAEALRYAILICGVVLCPIAAAFFFASGVFFARHRQREAAALAS